MEFIHNECPICGKIKPLEIDTVLGRDERNYKVVQCPTCNLYFVSPFPILSQEDYSQIYDVSYYNSNWGDQGCGYFNPEKTALMQAEAERQRLAIQQETGLSTGSVLDVGCADGRYLQAFAKAGWKAVGIEVSPEAVDRAKTPQGVEIIHGAIESIDLQGRRFDIVRLKHCIEHLSFPRQTLLSIHKLLKPGGYLVLDTDNADGLRSKCERFIRRVAGPVARVAVKQLMKKDLRNRFGRLSPPIHLLYFSSDSLTYALQSTGYEIQRLFSIHHGHPVWFPLVHPYRCHPIEASFRLLDRFGAMTNHGEAIVCFARKPISLD